MRKTIVLAGFSLIVAVWPPIYGEEKIQTEKPFVASLKNGVWTVLGSLPKDFAGGAAIAEISKRTDAFSESATVDCHNLFGYEVLMNLETNLPGQLAMRRWLRSTRSGTRIFRDVQIDRGTAGFVSM